MNLFFLKYDTHVRFVVAKVNCRFEFQIGKFIMLGHHQYYSLTTVTAFISSVNFIAIGFICFDFWVYYMPLAPSSLKTRRLKVLYYMLDCKIDSMSEINGSSTRTIKYPKHFTKRNSSPSAFIRSKQVMVKYFENFSRRFYRSSNEQDSSTNRLHVHFFSTFNSAVHTCIRNK